MVTFALDAPRKDARTSTAPRIASHSDRHDDANASTPIPPLPIRLCNCPHRFFLSFMLIGISFAIPCAADGTRPVDGQSKIAFGAIHQDAGTTLAKPAGIGGQSASTGHPVPIPAPQFDTLGLAFAMCFTYWVLMTVSRWHRIARPTREMLRAQLWCMLYELDLLGRGDRVETVRKILQSGLTLIEGDKDNPSKWTAPSVADFLFWSRGKEITGWGYVHEAAVQMVPLLEDDAVWVKLKTAEQELRTAADAESVALADEIKTELAAPPAARKSRRQQLLSQALTRNYEHEDTSFANLVTWQNKTAWLVTIGLLFIVALAGLLSKYSIFFLIGGLGGLVSRLSRSLDRKDVPTDYGASWTTLFLSPVAGALGAWAGLLLTELATKSNVLGSVFSNRWDDPYSQISLGIALLFGFSERLLDGILDKLAEQTSKGSDPQAKPSQATPNPQATGSPPSTAAAAPFASIPAAVVGAPYSHRLGSDSTDSTTQWTLKPGSLLPLGLALKSDGNVEGRADTSTAGQTFRFSVLASSKSGAVTLGFSIAVTAA
jgi:hypothetical protein